MEAPIQKQAMCQGSAGALHHVSNEPQEIQPPGGNAQPGCQVVL
jgi:hypothetical protein